LSSLALEVEVITHKIQLGVLGERYELPQWRLQWSCSWNWIWCMFKTWDLVAAIL